MMRRYRPTGWFDTEPGAQQEKIDFCDRDMVSELAPIDGSHWRLCLHPLHFRKSENPDLSALLNCPTADNPLFNPVFINAGRDRITQGKIYQLVVWENVGETPIPRMAIPVSEKTGKFWRQSVLQSLTHPYAPLGTPLVRASDDRGEKSADEIVERFLALLSLAFEGGMMTLLLDHLPVDTPICAALGRQEDAKNDSGLCVSIKHIGSRAVISKTTSDPLAHINKKRMREFRRQERKLGQAGEVTYEVTSDPMEILVRMEEFLLLEAKGWKGRQGTSIHNLKRHAAFARQAIYDFSKKGQAEIATLRVNNVAIASTLLISQNGYYFPWKTAYNETLSRYSPGTLLMVWLTGQLAQRSDFVGADSLAKYGSSWMTALWPDQREFCTAVIAEDCDRADAIQEDLSKVDRLKATAKKLLGRN